MRYTTVLSVLTVGLTMTSLPARAQTAEQQARFDQLSQLYADAGVIGDPDMVDCTLSGGEETLCIQITTGPAPTNHVTGPYCPRTINDPAEESGTWFFNDKVVAADGAFIKNLAVLFQDDEWQMYDADTGKVILVDGNLGCDVAGDPDSASEYTNYCVECAVSNLSEDTSETYVIPLVPVAAQDGQAARIGPSPGVGLAFNGVKLDAPAPLDLIEGNHTLGLMDSCVGHVNPHTGYHYHGLVGCEPQVAAPVEMHTALVAVAMDGYDIYAALGNTDRAGLDMCNGHSEDGLGYHYHSDAAGSNQFIGCFTAQYGCTSGDPTASCDASADARRGPPPAPE
ncbi:YHYH protein [Paracoccus sp. JM45]|uniref:YHYH protein n=1 Tax=Paracoccus sp. JM45 TaxID=2283626 RepID=UPI000E6CD5D3|nr:YHYH protein [Paracoccus sp. JM45]RJE79852.1 YHYH protein [Paracoccus sp. JM45]